MVTDKYGRQVLDETDLCSIYLTNPDQSIKNALVSDNITFPEDLDIKRKPEFKPYQSYDLTVKEFDDLLQTEWFMPDEYKNLDIAKWVLDRCKSEPELQRVGEELLKFQERDLFPLLRYCKYLVDTMKKHNIVWGVGRGSSVASYVLYLIGIHRINSLHYDISIDEFLK